MGEWQDISTAPKDGTRILTWGRLHADLDGGEAPCITISTHDVYGWYAPDFGGHEPALWQPLPPPPNTGKGEGV